MQFLVALKGNFSIIIPEPWNSNRNLLPKQLDRPGICSVPIRTAFRCFSAVSLPGDLFGPIKQAMSETVAEKIRLLFADGKV